MGKVSPCQVMRYAALMIVLPGSWITSRLLPCMLTDERPFKSCCEKCKAVQQVSSETRCYLTKCDFKCLRLQLPFNFVWPLILFSSEGYALNKVQHSQAFCALAGSTKPETPVRDNGCQGGSYQIKLQAWKKECFTGHITLFPHKITPGVQPTPIRNIRWW